MSLNKRIYLGPYLRIARSEFSGRDVYSASNGSLYEAKDCAAEISKAFVIALPNCGLTFDRVTMLSSGDATADQIENIDLDFERSDFAHEYREAIESIRKEIGDPTKAIVCWGVVVWSN